MFTSVDKKCKLHKVYFRGVTMNRLNRLIDFYTFLSKQIDLSEAYHESNRPILL